MRFSKKEMLNAAKKIREYINKNKKFPKELSMKDMDGKTRKLSKKQLCGLFDNQAGFFNTHKRLPNYTTLLYESSTPFRGTKQPTSVECGDTTLHNALTQLCIYISIAECKKLCKTNSNGTTPDNLIAAGKKCGVKITKIPRTFQAVKEAIDKGYSVIAHIQTAGNTRPKCLGYHENYGHWISIYNYSGKDKFKVYDPTMSYKTCTAIEIIKATNGRSINFYSVSPL